MKRDNHDYVWYHSSAVIQGSCWTVARYFSGKLEDEEKEVRRVFFWSLMLGFKHEAIEREMGD